MSWCATGRKPCNQATLVIPQSAYTDQLPHQSAMLPVPSNCLEPKTSSIEQQTDRYIYQSGESKTSFSFFAYIRICQTKRMDNYKCQTGKKKHPYFVHIPNQNNFLSETANQNNFLSETAIRAHYRSLSTRAHLADWNLKFESAAFPCAAFFGAQFFFYKNQLQLCWTTKQAPEFARWRKRQQKDGSNYCSKKSNEGWAVWWLCTCA